MKCERDPNSPKVNPNPFDFDGLDFEATYNAAPTDLMPVYLVRSKDNQGLTSLARWGLIPSWAKDERIGAKLINARADTISEKSSFRNAFYRRRCLVPMNGFFEWEATPSGKQPYYFRLLNSELFAAAGLYEWWKRPDGEWLQSFTVITGDPNEIVGNIHDRMPVVIEPEQWKNWLDPQNENPEALKRLLKPFPAEEMRCYPVSTRVNSVKNDGPELIEPLNRSE